MDINVKSQRLFPINNPDTNNAPSYLSGIKSNLFYSKLMLFGEYVSLYGGSSLVIPYKKYHGKLLFNEIISTNKAVNNSKESIKNFAIFQKKINSKILNLTLLFEDITKGIFFDSNIPQGYGLGSSGALIAAIYHRYSKNELISNKELKIKLSILESYFHGKSSGIDPLSSYLKNDLLINTNKSILLNNFEKKILQKSLFFINTKSTSNTKQNIVNFQKIYKNSNFQKLFINYYIPLNNKCISNLLANESISFFKNLKLLSKFIINYIPFLIPYRFHNLWREGIKSENYFLKICGSGNGGYILGFKNPLSQNKPFILDNNDIEYYSY